MKTVQVGSDWCQNTAGRKGEHQIHGANMEAEAGQWSQEFEAGEIRETEGNWNQEESMARVFWIQI